MRRIFEYAVIVFLLLFAVSSLFGQQIRFKRGATVPTSGEKGEPLWHTQGGFNGKGQLYIGYSDAGGRKAYKAYSSHIPRLGVDYFNGTTPVFGVDYFDGATIQPLFCNISGGTVSYQYDQTGLNPAPASTPMKMRLWLGNTRITPLHNQWNASGIVYGNRTGATFTPTVQTSYITAGSMVAGQGAYSTTVGYGAKRWCTATVSVAHSKTGATGATGPAGQDATVTRTAMFTKMTSTTQPNTAMNGTWQFQPTDGASRWAMAFLNHTGHVKIKINSLGYADFVSSNGYYVNRIHSNGTILLMHGGKVRTLIEGGQTTHYHTDGSTVSYKNYSNGAYAGKGGFGTAGQCLQSAGAGLPYTWGTCGSGGGGTPGGATKQYQYNNAGSFAGSPFMRYTSNGVILSGVVVVK